MRIIDLIKTPEPEPEPELRPKLTVVPNPNTTSYATTALARECEIMAATREGGRNHQLNTSAFNLAQLIGQGLDEQTIRDHLTHAAKQAGLPAHEISSTLNSGIRAGQKTPREIPQRPDLAPTITETDLQALGLTTVADFWNTRPVLAHIHAFALARMTSPWAVLAGCLLRAAATTPPHVVLPPTIGGVGSLNLLAALVGISGSGKGASEATAADAIQWPTQTTAPLGSGEGITHAYATPKRKTEPGEDTLEWHTNSVLFTAPEIDQVAAISSRRGSTLMTQLRSAYSGERLGMQYADSTRRIILPAHTYRFCLSVGVQPDRADALLDEADGGTPQRFLWAPTTDPAITATPPPDPQPWPWAPPIATPELVPGAYRDTHGRLILPIPDEITTTIREAHAARARGEGDALDGHALYTRLKVAAALAILDQRLTINDEDWDLAKTVMAMSDLTRAKVQARLQQRLDQADEGRAIREARRQASIAETLDEEAVKRVSRALGKHLASAGEITWSDARKLLRSDRRAYFEDAIYELIDGGQVAIVEGEGGRVLRWLQ